MLYIFVEGFHSNYHLLKPIAKLQVAQNLRITVAVESDLQIYFC